MSKFVWEAGDITIVAPQCTLCRRFAADTDCVKACAAFPGGIPGEIYQNLYDYRQPWIDPQTGEPGDTGIRGDKSILLEPKPDAPEPLLKATFAVIADRERPKLLRPKR